MQSWYHWIQKDCYHQIILYSTHERLFFNIYWTRKELLINLILLQHSTPIWYHGQDSINWRYLVHFSKFKGYCSNKQGSRLYSFSPFSIAPVIQHREVSTQLPSADSLPEALSSPDSLWRGQGSLQESHPSLSLMRIWNTSTSLGQPCNTDTVWRMPFTPIAKHSGKKAT